MVRVIGIGAGGHAKVLLDILRHRGGVNVMGLTDPARELWHTSFCGVPVLGDDTLLAALLAEGAEAMFVGVGSTGDSTRRRSLFDKARALGFRSIEIIHPSAVLGSEVRLGVGPMIMAGAIVNPGAEIGDNVILNTGTIIEHDCRIESHAHVATGARLAGAVWVETGAHIGAGATVRQSVRIGAGAIVGAGAAVIEDVPPGVTVVGVPARRLPAMDQPNR